MTTHVCAICHPASVRLAPMIYLCYIYMPKLPTAGPFWCFVFIFTQDCQCWVLLFILCTVMSQATVLDIIDCPDTLRSTVPVHTCWEEKVGLFSGFLFFHRMD